MDGDRPKPPEAQSLAQVRRVNDVCERYEIAWRVGHRPRIEDLLGEASGPERSALLGELLALELELRRGRGEWLDPREYQKRFPRDAEAIAVAFASMVAGGPDGPAHGDSATSPPNEATPQGPGATVTFTPTPKADASANRSVTPGRDRDVPTEVDPAVALRTSAGTQAGASLRFRILRPHARGGLGVVYVARDEELNRDVALKEIQAPFAGDELSRARFFLEAEITGGLEHPGVVPVYGLGCYANGRPYYAMRFIRGESLKEAIARYHEGESIPHDPGERAIAFRALLGRFVAVCNTVAYAHSRGILHRDIKPANVMLGPYGETLVVDWGLAKPIGRADPGGEPGTGVLRSSAAGALAATQSGSVVGTPAYMSPEQAAGDLETLGPTSDVYSLGATLYHLLTGRTAVVDRDLGVVLRKVRSGDFTPPRAVVPSLPRALEAVCLKAMALEPGARYGTPVGLADDLEHWLADEPVSAWREPWTTRARRWLARHRTLVTVGATAALVAILALGVVTLLQEQSRRRLSDKNRELRIANERTERARARAEEREKMAIETIDKFRMTVEENLDVKNRPDLAPLRKALLREPLQFYRRLREGLRRSRETGPVSRQELAEAYIKLARLTELIDSLPNAIGAYREAIEVLEPQYRDHPRWVQTRADLALAYNNLGILQLSIGQYAEAMDSHRRAITIREAMYRYNPADVEAHKLLASSYGNLAMAQESAGRPADALVSYRLAIDHEQAMGRDHSRVTDYRAGMAAIYSNLGTLQGATGRLAEAAANFEAARDLLEEAVRNSPGNADDRAKLAAIYSNLGKARLADDEMSGVRANYERSRDLYEALVHEHPTTLAYQNGLAKTCLNIHELELKNGRPAEALASSQRARDLFDVLVRDNPEALEMRILLGGAWNNIGIALEKLQRPEDAVVAYQKAIEHQRLALAKAPRNAQSRQLMGFHHSLLARVQLELGHPAEAAAAALGGREFWPYNPRELYLLARVLASCVPLVGRTEGSATEREQAERRYADQAMGVLRQSVAAGFKDASRLKNDPGFAPLRSREDFRILVRNLAMPASPVTR